MVRDGSLVLVLDQGHFHSVVFLNALLSNVQQKIPIKIVTFQDVSTKFNQVRLETVKSVSDLGILLSTHRDRMKQGIIIHHYFPNILIQLNEDMVLKLVEHWVTQIQGKPFLEFITLPGDTFPSFEKKLQVVLQGTIRLGVKDVEGEYAHTFSLLRACRPEYHGREFLYTVKDSRLLIKLGEEFIDRLPTSLQEQIRQRKIYLAENVSSLKVVIGDLTGKNLTPTDHLLLTQMHGMHLRDIQLLFYDMFEEILNKLSEWIVRGAIQTVKTEDKRSVEAGEKVGSLTKLALSLPPPLSTKMLGGFTRSVPIESLLGVKKSVGAILETYLPSRKEPKEDLASAERLIHEIAARITAASRTELAGENPWKKLDIRYLPRIVYLTLYIGFKLKSKTVKKSDVLYEVTVKDCFACEEMKSDRPVCHMISGTLAGALSQAFKTRLVCDEVKCKAMGDSECVFSVRKL